MIAEYIQKAMAIAVVEKIGEGEYAASVPGFVGALGFGKTRIEAKDELHGVFEEWLVVALRADDELPELDGVSLNFGGKQWHKQPVGGR